MTDAADLIDQARGRLHEADPRGRRLVRLGRIATSKKILGIARAPRVEPVHSAWHLGVLLIGNEGVWHTMEIVRAQEELPRGFTSENQRRRAELATAAFRGGFAEGESVHVGWDPVDPAAPESGSSLLLVRDRVPHVRWSAVGEPMPLERYLDERIALFLASDEDPL